MARTVFSKDGQEVVLEECFVIKNGSLKTFCIKESEQYFSSEKRGIRAANDLLLKKTLSKFDYNKKQQEKKNRIGANRIIRIHKCFKETQDYVTRWENILYLKTKKMLLSELKQKVESECVKYGFESVNSAIGYLKKVNK